MAAKKVSFIRIGEFTNRSKSKLINEFLREQNEEHATFFHKDCARGQNERTLSNGVIEITWLQSSSRIEEREVTEDKHVSKCNISDNAKECFSEKNPLSIMNLRGDASIFSEQIKILCHLSDLFVVLIDVNALQRQECFAAFKAVHDSDAHVLLVTELQNRQSVEQLESHYATINVQQNKTDILSLFDIRKRRKLNTSDFRKVLFAKVTNLLANVSNVESLEDVLSRVNCNLTLDEDYDACKEGKTLANKLFSKIDLEISYGSSIKDKNVPLQGHLWHSWSEKQRRT